MFTNVKDLISFIESQKRSMPKVSLDRFKKILSLFNNPQNNIRYIHIGGTNGKGSTVSYTKSILREAKYNVATYVSPYVKEFSERITYNDNNISDDHILNIGNYIINNYSLLEENNLEKLSFFEFTTLMAFLYFSRIKELDFVILEVGLGGLLDMTNVIIPEVTAITNIDYDHMNVLGDTLEEIAMNKLGIVKEKRPLITMSNQRLNKLFVQKTKETNSELILVNESDYKNIKLSLENTIYSYKNYNNIKLKLLGAHQIKNSSIAIEIILYLKGKLNLNITDKNIYDGLEKTFWPGRLEIISNDPLIIIDGAHNIDAIKKLVDFINSIKVNRFIKIVFAVSANKEKEKMIKILDSVADELVFSSFHYSRSEIADNLIDLSNHFNKRIEEDLSKIVKESLLEKDKTTIFCGSLYFISELYQYFNVK